jgi:hypothetical protein
MGMISLFSFALSVIAAVLAIDMYALLRTGEFGPTWRVLIIASVMFALVQALKMADYFDWKTLDTDILAQVVELAFALCIAYAFYLQRKAFGVSSQLRRDRVDREPTEDEVILDEDSASQPARTEDWSRLGGIYQDRK